MVPVVALLFAQVTAAVAGASSQDAVVSASATTVTLCGQPVPAPQQLPPAGSAPVVYMLGLCFPTEGNVSVVEPDTYLYYVKLRPSRPSQAQWAPFDEDAREVVAADFKRLWATGFLEDLRIEADDYVFANGVVGKVISYYMEERQRIKVIRYDTSLLDRSKIEETLKTRGITLQSDSFLDRGTLSRVQRVLRELLSEKGYPDPKVTYDITPESSSTLVDLTFHMAPGPRLAIRNVTFLGNRAASDAELERQLKSNRPEGLLSFATHAGGYNAEAFGDDAQRLVAFYRNRGFIEVRVGQPEVKRLDESAGGTTAWVQLRVPVVEGRRYKLGTLSFEGNTALSTKALQSLFTMKTGQWYSDEPFRDAIKKASEAYGAGGYIEFTAFPDLQPRADTPDQIVDVVVRITEGPQYTINRLTFTGNTFTHDEVIRREVALVEGGLFSTESLKYSIRRLNQLGYFKPLEGSERDVKVDRTVNGTAHVVDVNITVEEQNRNQLQMGAGVSQYEGVFGNLSYTTSNFIGRGESLTLAAQKGDRSSTYQIGFTEPYVYSRPISAGLELYTRRNDFLETTGTVAYSEARSGVSLTVGHPLFRYSRLMMGYGFEVIEVAASESVLNSLTNGAGVPVFNAAIDEGRHTESRLSPVFMYNSVDSPIMPHRGTRLQVTPSFVGGFMGGTTSYIKAEIDAAKFIPVTRRTGFGLHTAAGRINGYGSTKVLPYYTRYFLGGETQIRGVDIRTVGPVDRNNRAIGGNKYALFNAEYYLDLFGPVRALVFHDAGQAYSEHQSLDLRRLRTSSGVELRFMMPVLNVPFRLIYSWNLYRDTFQPARGFKFAVGTTF